METLSEFKQLIDPFIAKILREKVTVSKETLTDDMLSDLVRHAEQLVMSGGKRARPYVAWLTYRSLGGQPDNAVLQLLVAIELFHSFCLIHDDIMDQGSTRHGVATVHSYATTHLTHAQRTGNIAHVGEAQAILIGDLLASWSWEILSLTNDLALDRLHAARREFARMSEEVILGQMIDIDITTRHDVSPELIERKMILKTARYTFVQPMKIGAALAGELEAYSELCESVGTALGLAYQTQDDMLDILANTDTLQKNTLADLQQHQHTFLTSYTFMHGTSQQKAALTECFTSHTVTPAQAKTALEAIRTSGAIDAARKRTEAYFATAREAVEVSSLSTDWKEHWAALIDFIEHRSH